MIPATESAPAERLTRIIDLLCRATAARIAGGRLAGPIILLICAYLGRAGSRFRRLAARIEAGRDRPRGRAASRAPASRARRSRLPQGVGWLVRLVPETASGGSQLQHLLMDPEMAALIAASPRTGRLLRPLCRMLGVTPPPALVRLPRRAAPAAPSPPATVRPSGAAPPVPAPARPRGAAAPLRHPPGRGPPPVPA